jgi:hypothetical protein
VQRDGHNHRRIPKVWPTDGRPQEREEFPQFSAQPFATLKLQLQDGGPQVSAVEVEAAGEIERIFLAMASGAKSIARVEGALTGEKKATSGAKGAPPGAKALPALPANAGSRRPVELFVAQGAIRWKESCKQTID